MPVMKPADEQLWTWVAEVSDPEIPVLSITDLGIVRAIDWHDGACEVTITPTYSGCPAMHVIEDNIKAALQQHGVSATVRTVLSPAWTTDWITANGRSKLQAYGIAPPAAMAPDAAQRGTQAGTQSGTQSGAQPGTRSVNVSALFARRDESIACPQCGSFNTRLVSQFGSTACKALYRCADCLEPFDYFKPH